MDILQDEEVEGGIVINPNSAYAKEMRKHEMWPSVYGRTPGRPFAQYATEYPRMLYLARKHPRSGKYSAGEIYPNAADFEKANEYERAFLLVDTFNKSCQKKVEDADAQSRAYADGWRATATEALAYAESFEIEMGRVAAEVEFGAKRMSDQAQRELKQAHTETHEHVVDVQPAGKRRGRPSRVVTGSGEVAPDA